MEHAERNIQSSAAIHPLPDKFSTIPIPHTRRKIQPAEEEQLVGMDKYYIFGNLSHVRSWLGRFECGAWRTGIIKIIYHIIR